MVLPTIRPHNPPMTPIRKLIMLAIDGLGMYNMQNDVDMPCLESLVSMGTIASASTAIHPDASLRLPVSLPNWVALWSGLSPADSGVRDNDGHYYADPGPWIWKYADKRNVTSSLFYTYDGVSNKVPTTSRDDYQRKSYTSIPHPERDKQLQRAVHAIEDYDFTTIYMGELDMWCHMQNPSKYKEMSKEYDDKVVCPVLHYLEANLRSTAVVVVSDHSSDLGKRYKHHGTGDVPLVTVAPGLDPASLGKVKNTAAFAMVTHLLRRLALHNASHIYATLCSAAAAAHGSAGPVAIMALAVAAWTGLQTFL